MNLLRKIDHYLLINHPILWRTKVHYFVLFSLILGNVAAIGSGYFLVERYGAIDVEFIPLSILVLIGFCGLIWIFSQVRIKIKTYKFWDEVLLFSIYIFCSGCILSNSLIFERTVTYKIAHLASVEQIDRDYKTLEQYYNKNDIFSDTLLKEMPIATLEKMEQRYGQSNSSKEYKRANKVYSKLGMIRYMQRCLEMRRPLEMERLTCGMRFEPYIISRSKYLEIWIAAFLSVFLLAHVNFRTFLLGILLEFLLFFSMMAALAREGYWNMFFVSFTVLLLLIFSLKMSDNQFTKQLFALVLIPYIPICLLGYFYLNGGFYDKFTLIFIAILLMITPFMSASFIKQYFEPAR